MAPRTWLVTGASSGIGYQIALHARALNDVVVATSRNADNLSPLQHLGCKTAVLNLSWPAQRIQAVVKEIQEEVSTIDVLVNAAGYILQGCIEESSDDEIEDIYAANLLGPIRLIQAILPHMRARNQGTISAVGGVGALNGAGGAANFSASKAGLTIAMQGLRAEVAHLGIRVCLIQLGHFRTAFLEAGHRTKTQKSLEDYQPLMGPTGKAFDALNGAQKGSPASAGKAIVEVLSGTGRAAGRETPAYLELGADVRAATLQAQAFRDHQASAWEDISTSTNL